METPAKTHDSLGRSRRITQGGAGNKTLPDKNNALKAGEFNDSPPPGLDEYGLFWWSYVVRNMRQMGILDGADWMSIAMSSYSYQDYMHSRDDIGENRILMDDHGNQKRHPAFATRRETAAEVKSYLSEFALTASSRAKFGAGNKEDDAFEKVVAAQLAASMKGN